MYWGAHSATLRSEWKYGLLARSAERRNRFETREGGRRVAPTITVLTRKCDRSPVGRYLQSSGLRTALRSSGFQSAPGPLRTQPFESFR